MPESGAKIAAMTFTRRLGAATMILVLAFLPVALERCRTECVSGSAGPQTASADHACHDMAADEAGTRLDPMARACGHSDEARTFASTSLVPGKTRTMVAPLAAVQRLPGGAELPCALPAGDPPVRSFLSLVALPLDLPLRL